MHLRSAHCFSQPPASPPVLNTVVEHRQHKTALNRTQIRNQVESMILATDMAAVAGLQARYHDILAVSLRLVW